MGRMDMLLTFGYFDTDLYVWLKAEFKAGSSQKTAEYREKMYKFTGPSAIIAGFRY